MTTIYWTTHSKKLIPLQEMIDEHLINSINMVERGHTKKGEPILEEQKQVFNALIAEAERRTLLRAEEIGWDK